MWANIEGSAARSSSEMGFFLDLRKSHKRMGTQGNLAGLSPQLLKALFGLETWNLMDLRFADASEWSNFKPHKDT